MQTILRDGNISIALVTDGRNHTVTPKWLVWENARYTVCSLNMVYTERRGIKKVHVLAMNVGRETATAGAEGTLDMLVEIDSESLAPTLVMVSDGLAD